MKRIKILVAIAGIAVIMLGAVYAGAMSTIYVFNDWRGGAGRPACTLFINGVEVGSLLGEESKRINCSSWNDFEIPAITYNKAVRPCIVDKEGKTVFSIEMQWTNMLNTEEVYKYADECQLDLVDGETYYIQLKRKGLTKMQFIELKPKDGEKLLKKNKYELLDEVTVQ